MAPIKLVCDVKTVNFEPAEDNGEFAEITLKTSVIGAANKQLLADLAVHNVRWAVELRPRGEQEDKPKAGIVSGFKGNRFQFLMPPAISRTGLAKGTYVITESGIVGVVLDAQAAASDLFRRLVDTGATTPERLQAEMTSVEYTCAMIGGVKMTPTGQVPYYHTPGFFPVPGQSVYTVPPKQFFQWDDAKQTALFYRLAVIMQERDVDPGVSAMMIGNAAWIAGYDKIEYMDAVLGVIDDGDRYTAIENACVTMFEEKMYDDV